MRQGIESKNRRLLENLHRHTSGPFSIDEAREIWDLPRDRTQRLLAYLAERGWLTRIRRGLYTTVPLGATDPTDWRADPWLVADQVFSPCYIGGWTALEHWGLTEQLFRDVVVLTARKVRSRVHLIQETKHVLKHRDEGLHFGTRRVWRDESVVRISNPERTLIDVLDDPSIGGGIRHIAGCLQAYFEGSADDDRLVEYGIRLGNRTVFKRLGFLLEALEIQVPGLVDRCAELVSAGLSPLDPTVEAKGRVLKRWNLRVNVGVGR